MRVVKPQQLSLLHRPFDYRGKHWLGVATIAAVPLGEHVELIPEVELWQQVLPLIDQGQSLDYGIPKRGGEFLVSGQACAPDGETVPSMRVRVEVGSRSKELWVFGDRYFDGNAISLPDPFSTMPLDWSRAFGGPAYKSNPLGKGLGPSANARGDKRHWLPNVEHPDDLLRLKSQRPMPAGFGPLDITWPQRLSLAGTYDDRWLKTRFPGFADDVQWGYFNLSARDQWLEKSFQGGEDYRLVGFDPQQRVIEGAIPKLTARTLFRRRAAEALEEVRCHLTTLWFFPEIDRLVLIYHASIEIETDDASDIDCLLIAAEHSDRPRDKTHYAGIMHDRTDPESDALELLRDQPLMPEGLAKSPFAEVYQEARDKGPSARMQRMRGSVDHAIDRLRTETEEKGSEFPEDQVPEFEDETLPELDELDAFIEQKLEQLNRAREDVETKKQALRERVRAELEEAPDFVPGLEDFDAISGHRGPPTFKAAEQRRAVERQAENIREMEQDPSAIETRFCNDEQYQLWLEAEANLNNLYRLAAHHQEPIGPAERNEARVQELLELIASGQSVRDQNFCGIDLRGRNLSGRDLSGIFLESANLEQADLSDAILDDAVLAHANLKAARLNRCSLKNANLGKSSMQSVQAVSADFTGAVLSGCDMSGSDLSGSTVEDVEFLLEPTFNQCNFSGARMQDLLFYNCVVEECNFSGAKLRQPIFNKVELRAVDFSAAALDGAVFIRTRGIDAGFVEAQLKECCFLDESDFTGADFSGAQMPGTNLRGCQLGKTSFAAAEVDDCDFSDAFLGGSVFRDAIGHRSRWVRTDLRDADLAGAQLTESVLKGADVRGGDLRANLFKADLAMVHVDRPTRFDGAYTAKMNTYPRRFRKDSDG